MNTAIDKLKVTVLSLLYWLMNMKIRHWPPRFLSPNNQATAFISNIMQYILPFIINIVSLAIDLSIKIGQLLAALRIFGIQLIMRYTHSNIIGATIDGRNVTIAARHYYNTDPHHTTSSLIRWLSKFTVSPKEFAVMFTYHDDVCYSIIDLNSNIEMRSRALLPNDSVSLHELHHLIHHIR